MHLHEFMKDPVKFLDVRHFHNPAPLQEIYLGPKRFILVFDPEVAQTILIQKSDIYVQSRNVFDRIKPVTGKKGLVQLEGSESRNYRRMSRPLFAAHNMERLNHIVASYIEETLDGLKPGSPVDIMTLMTEFTMRTAFSMFLGIDIKDSSYPFGKNFYELNQLCGKRMLSPLGLPSLRLMQLKRSLRSELKKYIQSETQELNVMSIYKDEDSLIDQCLTFLFAGHETTAASLAFTFLLLSEHPEYQAKINQDPEMALKVYKESLRLYTPAYMLAREAGADDELGGIRIRKGDQILIGMKQIHRLEKYFKHPEQFIPERFEGTSSMAFFPFGKGPKSCIGEALAYQEAVTVIKAFCRRFHIQARNKNIVARPLITLHPEAEVLYVS